MLLLLHCVADGWLQAGSHGMHGGFGFGSGGKQGSCRRSARRQWTVVTRNVWFMRKRRERSWRQGSQGSADPTPGEIGVGVSSRRQRTHPGA